MIDPKFKKFCDTLDKYLELYLDEGHNDNDPIYEFCKWLVMHGQYAKFKVN